MMGHREKGCRESQSAQGNGVHVGASQGHLPKIGEQGREMGPKRAMFWCLEYTARACS